MYTHLRRSVAPFKANFGNEEILFILSSSCGETRVLSEAMSFQRPKKSDSSGDEVRRTRAPIYFDVQDTTEPSVSAAVHQALSWFDSNIDAFSGIFDDDTFRSQKSSADGAPIIRPAGQLGRPIIPKKVADFREARVNIGNVELELRARPGVCWCRNSKRWLVQAFRRNDDGTKGTKALKGFPTLHIGGFCEAGVKIALDRANDWVDKYVDAWGVLVPGAPI